MRHGSPIHQDAYDRIPGVPATSWIHFVITFAYMGLLRAWTRVMRSASAALRVCFALALAAAPAVAGCADDGPVEEEGSGEDFVKVDTSSPEARAQYDADVAFANAYTARCAPKGSAKRVLVTGFGRFMSVGNNATGRIVSTLVPEAVYPETSPPPAGQVDPPGPQLSVGTRVVDLPGAGRADVCGMVLPVYWDLAAILVSKEIEAFKPDLVVMMGVAGGTQPIWIELGAVNKAAPLDDGSDRLQPAVREGQDYAPIVETATSDEQARGNLMSWQRVQSAAEAKAKSLADRRDSHGSRFGDAGYNTLSTTALWPWPNEARIKREMCAATTRGFCSSGKRLDGVNPITLTSYVWEMLGTAMPATLGP